MGSPLTPHTGGHDDKVNVKNLGKCETISFSSFTFNHFDLISCMRKKSDSFFVIDLSPKSDQATKPTELIQITGHQSLTLNARRSITLLWHNAHMQGIEEGRDYTIEIDDLIASSHKGYEVVEEAVVALMQALITVKHPDGATTRVQFLGGNDMDSPDRPAGTLTYSFDKRLVNILKNSTIWGKISLPVLVALSSKYGISLYENVSQWVGLTNKTSQIMTLDQIRTMLGVETHKYPRFSDLNKHILKPVVQELNALAPFNLTVLPIKTGKKVTHLRLGWWLKDKNEVKEAWQELQRSKIGRKARISDSVSMVLEPSASINRVTRKGIKDMK